MIGCIPIHTEQKGILIRQPKPLKLNLAGFKNSSVLNAW
jgi:hypothetical protein